MLLVYLKHPLVERAEIHLADRTFVFAPHRLPGARQLVMAAEVDDADVARAAALAYPTLLELHGVHAAAQPSAPAQPAPVVVPSPSAVVHGLRERILARGWRVVDLEGLPDGEDLSPSAGRSLSTGLGAVEMLATVPPERWPDLAAHYYPWQIGGWQPPDNEWKPSGVPAKPPAAVEPATIPDVIVADDVLLTAGEQPADAAVVSGPPDIGPDHPAVGVYGTLEQVRAARVIAWNLLGPDGSRPTFTKLASQLKANYDLGLPELGAGHMKLLYS